VLYLGLCPSFFSWEARDICCSVSSTSLWMPQDGGMALLSDILVNILRILGIIQVLYDYSSLGYHVRTYVDVIFTKVSVLSASF